MKNITDRLLRSEFWETIKNFQNTKSINFESNDILLFGEGARTKKFYREIAQEDSVELLWTGSGTSNKTIRVVVPYECGLLKIKKFSGLSHLLSEIGENSECGLYYVHGSSTPKILHEIKTNLYNYDINKFMTDEYPFFLMEINFDIDEEGELIGRDITYSENLPEEIVNTLKLNK